MSFDYAAVSEPFAERQTLKPFPAGAQRPPAPCRTPGPRPGTAAG